MDAAERLICRAALAHPAVAARAWREWRAAHDPATAPSLLAWAGGYIARNLRRGGRADPYLEGIARHHWLGNSRTLARALPVLRELAVRFAIVPLKSFANAADPDAWRLRPLADVDLLVGRDAAEPLVDELLARGFVPLLGPDRQEITARIMNQRGSWNFVRGAIDLDVHWRVLDHLDDRTNAWLVERWSGAAKTAFGTSRVLRPEVMLCLLSVQQTLQGRGTGGLFDVFETATRVDAAASARLARATDTVAVVTAALSTARDLGGDWHPGVARVLTALEARRRAGRRPRGRGRDRQAADARRAAGPYLRRAWPYRLWSASGGSRLLERWLLRATGPWSRGVVACGPGRSVIDPLTEPELGPGWHHLFPGDRWRWAGASDARLALRLPHAGRAEISVRLAAAAWRDHACGTLGLFADGALVATAGREQPQLDGTVTTGVGQRVVELSLRYLTRSAGPQRGILAPRNALGAPVERVIIHVVARETARVPAARAGCATPSPRPAAPGAER